MLVECFVAALFIMTLFVNSTLTIRYKRLSASGFGTKTLIQ
jgi:hypothetical protein